MIDRLLLEQKVRVVQTMEFDNIETVKRAVEIESGLSIVPESSVQDEVRNGSLVAVELDCFEVWRSLAVIYRRHKAISPAQKQFVTLLKELPWSAENGQLVPQASLS